MEKIEKFLDNVLKVMAVIIGLFAAIVVFVACVVLSIFIVFLWFKLSIGIQFYWNVSLTLGSLFFIFMLFYTELIRIDFYRLRWILFGRRRWQKRASAHLAHNRKLIESGDF